MKRILSGLAALSVIALPTLASAKAVEHVRFDTDASDVIVTVVADEALARPSVRTTPGAVRVRFYDALDTKLMHLRGDGSAVRALDLGRGSDQSAALTINLGDRTKLLASDVRVETDGDTTTLRIARGLLPAVRGGAVAPVSAKPAVAAVAPEKPEAAVQAPSTSTVTVTEESAEPVLAPPKQAAEPKLVLGKSKVAEAPAQPLKLNNESSPMPVLLAVSALLAIAYAGLQFTLRKKKNLAGTDIPVIDVMAQRRIGPRHQLVIVRAFDRDYLLSIQGGQTTVVARSSRKRVQEAEALLSPLPSARAKDDTRSRAFEEDDEPTFGGELFKQALEQRERARENTASMRLANRDPWGELAANAYERTRREPTSGIQREERREPTSSVRSERRDRRESSSRLEALRSELDAELARDRDERDEHEDDFLPPPSSAVSESVSGLLRLRKQAGR